MKYDAIVLAAGSATRANLYYNKMFYKIDDKPMVYVSTINFKDDKDCQKIIVAVNEKEQEKMAEIFKNEPKVCLTIGGKTRQESVNNALKLITSDYVLIHDGARPCFSNKLLCNLKENVVLHDAVIPVIGVSDTIFEVKDNKVEKLLERNKLKAIQTPQAFKTSIIKLAHNKANKNTYSDDSSMVKEILNQDIYVVDGEIENKKYTYSKDFRY